MASDGEDRMLSAERLIANPLFGVFHVLGSWCDW